MDLENTEWLFGHTDETTALLVDDYPYGRRVRTQIRYWMETTKHGDRFCSQTLNPKTGRWNNPKKSTYSAVGVMFREADTGHVKWSGIGDWPKPEYLRQFIEVMGPKLSERQKLQLAAVAGRVKAFENVTFSVKRGALTETEKVRQERTEAQVWALARAEAIKAKGAMAGVPEFEEQS